MGEMGLATKDHIEHIEKDGKMDWKKRRLGEDTSPYLGPRGCWGAMGNAVA